MDGPSVKKSKPLETLVIQNISNVNDLKTKLNDIISAGKSFEYDVSSCLKVLLNSSDEAIVLLSVQAICELADCERQRETFAQTDIILPMLNILDKELTDDKLELNVYCVRALGILCDDEVAAAREIAYENNMIEIFSKLLEQTRRHKVMWYQRFHG